MRRDPAHGAIVSAGSGDRATATGFQRTHPADQRI